MNGSDFSLDGYGIYVWPAYLAALAVLVWNIAVPFVKLRQHAAHDAVRGSDDA